MEKEAEKKRESEKCCEKMWVCEGSLLYQKRAFSFYLNGYTQLLLYTVGLVPDYLHDKRDEHICGYVIEELKNIFFLLWKAVD